MLIAEDLPLLVTDGVTGRLLAPAITVDIALGGANMVELTLLGKICLSGAGYQGKRAIIRDGSPTGDEVLDRAVRTLSAPQGTRLGAAVRRLGKKLRPDLYSRLAAAGLVRPEQRRALGVIPVLRWPAQDARHAAEVRAAVTQALAQQAEPDARTAALVGLLHALRCEHKAIDPLQLSLPRRQLRARAGQIAASSWANEAAGGPDGELISAILAATRSAILAATSS